MAQIEIDTDGFIVVHDCYEQRKVVGDIGGSWDGINKVWRVIFTAYNLEYLLDNLENLSVPPDIENLVIKQLEKERKLLEIREMSKQDVPVSFKIPGLKMPLRNYQKLGVMFAVENGAGVLNGDHMGLGKQNPVDTPVLTQNGWVPIGNLRIGDRVYARDGKPYPVLGVYPQGVKELVRVTFSDKVTSECGWEHLWMVRSTNDSKRGRDWRVLDTKSLSVDLRWGKNYRATKWQIPLVEPIQYQDTDLIIPPYIMGVLLGDGSLTNGGVSFVPGDDDVPVIVGNFLPDGYEVHRGADYDKSTRFSIAYCGNGNPMSREITRLGLRLTGEHKFIPDDYKTVSVKQRMELLAGLLDTDGTVKSARTRFATTSERLADDVADLIRSLGGMAVKNLTPGRLRVRDGKTCQELDCWQLTIRTAFNPFLVESNRIKWRRSSKLVRKIVSIEPCRTAEAVCISVGSPDSTYVVKDYVVTHNTLQGIATALYWKAQHRINNALIVTPASLKYNWPIEIEKFTDEKYVVIDGTGGERIAQWLSDDVFFYIVNYELIVEDLFGGRKFKEKEDETAVDKARRVSMTEKAKQRERILAPLRRRVWGAIIIDEAQQVKSHGARRSQSVKSLHANFRMALTGTPMDGRLEELHSIMGFVAPGLLGSKARFFQRHVETDFYGRVTGYKRIGEVTKRIEPFFIRRLKQDVLKELPDKIYENKIITLSPEEMKIYKELAKGGHEATADEEAIVAVIRCKQFCNYPQMIEPTCGKMSKMEAFKEILDEVIVQNGHKALVFSQYKTMLDFIVPVLDEMGLKYFRIDGDTPPKERAAIQQKFNTDSKIDLVIGTDAMAFGLNLTGASYVVNFDDSWSPSTMEQRCDRAHRIGQKSVVTVVGFVCRDTIEQRIRAVLAAKSKITAEVLGDETDEMLIRRLSPKEIASLL